MSIDEKTLESLKDELTNRKLASIRLSKEEEHEYRAFCTLGLPHIPPEDELGMFQLFLNGSTTEEICRVNNGKYTKGQIINSRIESHWDDKVSTYKQDLIARQLDRLQMVQVESLNFMANLISATNRLNNEKILKYMQSGDHKELGDLQIGSLAGYKTAIELLHALSGQRTGVEPGKRGRPAKPVGYGAAPDQDPEPDGGQGGAPAVAAAPTDDPTPTKKAQVEDLLKAIIDSTK